MDADSLAYGCVILGLDVPEQKKGNIFLLKYILRQLGSEDVEGSDDGDSCCYAKLHDHFRVISLQKNVMCLLVSNKNLRTAFSFDNKNLGIISTC